MPKRAPLLPLQSDQHRLTIGIWELDKQGEITRLDDAGKAIWQLDRWDRTIPRNVPNIIAHAIETKRLPTHLNSQLIDIKFRTFKYLVETHGEEPYRYFLDIIKKYPYLAKIYEQSEKYAELIPIMVYPLALYSPNLSDALFRYIVVVAATANNGWKTTYSMVGGLDLARMKDVQLVISQKTVYTPAENMEKSRRISEDNNTQSGKTIDDSPHQQETHQIFSAATTGRTIGTESENENENELEQFKRENSALKARNAELEAQVALFSGYAAAEYQRSNDERAIAELSEHYHHGNQNESDEYSDEPSRLIDSFRSLPYTFYPGMKYMQPRDAIEAGITEYSEPYVHTLIRQKKLAGAERVGATSIMPATAVKQLHDLPAKTKEREGRGARPGPLTGGKRRQSFLSRRSLRKTPSPAQP